MLKVLFKVLRTRILNKKLFLQTLCQKDGEALQKFLKFDTRLNIVGRFTVECVFGCLLRNLGCLFA